MVSFIAMQKKTWLSENKTEKHKGMHAGSQDAEGFLEGTGQEIMTRYDNVVMTSLCHCVLPPFLAGGRSSSLGWFFFSPPCIKPRTRNISEGCKLPSFLLLSLYPSLLSFLLPCPLHSLPSPGTSSSKSKSSWPSSSLLSDPGIFTA